MEATCMKSAKAKLLAAPGNAYECEFNRMLVDRLHDEMIPDGAVLAVMLLEYDLERGIDGFTMKPLESSFKGLPPLLVRLCSRRVIMDAAKYFPEEFAKQMVEAFKETTEQARAHAGTSDVKS